MFLLVTAFGGRLCAIPKGGAIPMVELAAFLVSAWLILKAIGWIFRNVIDEM
jgi:hypothetical protein